MGLRLKFNLILLTVFAAGFLTVGAVAQRYLTRQAVDDATRAALLTMDAAILGNLDARTAEALGSRLVEMKVREFSADAGPSGVEGEAFGRLNARDNSNNQVSGIFTTPTGEQRLVVAPPAHGCRRRRTDAHCHHRFGAGIQFRQNSLDHADEFAGRGIFCGFFRAEPDA